MYYHVFRTIVILTFVFKVKAINGKTLCSLVKFIISQLFKGVL